MLITSKDEMDQAQPLLELSGVWAGAVALSWGETSQETNSEHLLEIHGKSFALTILGSLAHAASELGLYK